MCSALSRIAAERVTCHLTRSCRKGKYSSHWPHINSKLMPVVPTPLAPLPATMRSNMTPTDVTALSVHSPRGSPGPSPLATHAPSAWSTDKAYGANPAEYSSDARPSAYAHTCRAPASDMEEQASQRVGMTLDENMWFRVRAWLEVIVGNLVRHSSKLCGSTIRHKFKSLQIISTRIHT